MEKSRDRDPRRGTGCNHRSLQAGGQDLLSSLAASGPSRPVTAAGPSPVSLESTLRMQHTLKKRPGVPGPLRPICRV